MISPLENVLHVDSTRTGVMDSPVLCSERARCGRTRRWGDGLGGEIVGTFVLVYVVFAATDASARRMIRMCL